MSLEGLLVGLVLVAAALFIVLTPLLTVRNTTPSVLEHEQQLQRLQISYEMVLTNISDLDEDHLTGKLSTEAYRAERDQWLQQAVSLLREIDLVQAVPAVTMQMDEDRVEAALKAYRADYSASTQQD